MLTTTLATLGLLLSGCAVKLKWANWTPAMLREVQDTGTEDRVTAWKFSTDGTRASGGGESAVIRQTYRHYLIEDETYRFEVVLYVWPKRIPNVTVNGAVEYAMDNRGRFYLRDDDYRWWEMTVERKELLPPK